MKKVRKTYNESIKRTKHKTSTKRMKMEEISYEEKIDQCFIIYHFSGEHGRMRKYAADSK